MYTDPTMGPPDDMVDAANSYVELVNRLKKLADEWDEDANSDQRYLNGPSIGIGEGPELAAQIQLARQNAEALRDLIAEFPSVPALDRDTRRDR
jgi:hypothetical protein